MSKHDVQLGTTPTEADRRDAIHIAVVPAVAAEDLLPGEHVGFVEGRTMGKTHPQTITGMRHQWSHPDFDEEPEDSAPADAAAKAASEAWLRDFCDRSDCPGYETVLAAASGEVPPVDRSYGEAWENDGEYLHFNGRDAHGRIPPEFWDHVEVVTGKKIPGRDRARSFSCSC